MSSVLFWINPKNRLRYFESIRRTSERSAIAHVRLRLHQKGLLTEAVDDELSKCRVEMEERPGPDGMVDPDGKYHRVAQSVNCPTCGRPGDHSATGCLAAESA